MMREEVLPSSGALVKGKYRVEGIIGGGGISAVLAARHVVTGKPVALKWLRAGLSADPEWMRRILREARAAGRVHHPNVVDVYDIDEHAGVLFLVMERLRGKTLAAALEVEPVLPWWEAIELLLPVMRGVHAAHRQGVMHRDLNPANIFLCEDDTGAPLGPKVLDFGISKIVDAGAADSLLTETGAQLGTPAYMAPEQLAHTSSVDQRVDIYALGVVLFRVLSGRLPHSARTPVDLMNKILYEDAPELHRIAVVPRELSAIVARALARDPDARYRYVAELVIALEELWARS
jgi:serine/threonine protein kinase